ncbi:inner membrane CreD family protein [Arenimonas daejeonensis]|uniref:inner membrane CreD family protein n=1 Tax=Arenimonas daejeonensis TaxID=370777 RepID=UPI0011BD5DD6|nr:inner membrane CreD family protein [Arenimonas daejeonensis]
MRIGLKLGLVGFLLLLLLVPLAMLDGLVSERQMRGAEVALDIARSSAGPQDLVGPLLLVEAQKITEKKRVVSRDGHLSQETERASETVHYLISPATLAVDNRLRFERRGRSLFTVPLYHGALNIKGQFTHHLPPVDEGQLRPLRAWLVLGLGDNRGVRSLAIKLDGRPVGADPGTRIGWLPEGLSAPVPLAALDRPLDFDLALDLSGTGHLGWLPVGAETTVTASGAWPHPAFEGRHLPETPQIDDSGFTARWAVSRLSSRVQQVLAGCPPLHTDCPDLAEGRFSLRLVEPVDRYLMTDRAMKYALLFLAPLVRRRVPGRGPGRAAGAFRAVRPDRAGDGDVLPAAAVAVGARRLRAGLRHRGGGLQRTDRLLPECRIGWGRAWIGLRGGPCDALWPALCAAALRGPRPAGGRRRAVRRPGGGDGVDAKGGLESPWLAVNTPPLLCRGGWEGVELRARAHPSPALPCKQGREKGRR